MININENDLRKLEKYYKANPSYELVDLLVNELADILEKSSGLQTDIYQDMDEKTYYRLYSGCSAVEVYVQNNIIQIDFDMGWQLNQSLQSQNNLPL